MSLFNTDPVLLSNLRRSEARKGCVLASIVDGHVVLNNGEGVVSRFADDRDAEHAMLAAGWHVTDTPLLFCARPTVKSLSKLLDSVSLYLTGEGRMAAEIADDHNNERHGGSDNGYVRGIESIIADIESARADLGAQ